MSNKILFGLAASAAILLSACGGDVTEVTEVYNTGMTVIEKGEKIPKCTSDNEGAMIYAVDSAAAYFCVNRKWTSMKGDQGEPGKDGEQGEKGDKGDTGEQGEQGIKGDKGEQGEQGVKGDKGDPGEKGEQGEKGDAGEKGDQGDKGDKGEDGSSCTVELLPDSSGYKVICNGDSIGVVLNGADGEKGEKGDRGETGEQGPKGEDGDPGRDGIADYMIDYRDKQLYKTLTVGTQTWMAWNLNYNTENSYCYKNDCLLYGRYYTWATAMDSAAVFTNNAKGCGYAKNCTIKTPARGICPEGWHIPTTAEWETLSTTIGKSGADWLAKGYGNPSNATDAYGFSALTTGIYFDGKFTLVGEEAFFWSANEPEYSPTMADMWVLTEEKATKGSGSKNQAFPIRCIKD